jgi:hypothetical protein
MRWKRSQPPLNPIAKPLVLDRLMGQSISRHPDTLANTTVGFPNDVPTYRALDRGPDQSSEAGTLAHKVADLRHNDTPLVEASGDPPRQVDYSRMIGMNDINGRKAIRGDFRRSHVSA